MHGEPFIAYPRQAGVAVYEQTAALSAKLIGLTPRLGIALVPATLQTIAVPGVVFRHLDDTDTITTLYMAHYYRDANARTMQSVELAPDLR